MTPEERIQRTLGEIRAQWEATNDPELRKALEAKSYRLAKQQRVWASARRRGFKTTSPEEILGQHSS